MQKIVSCILVFLLVSISLAQQAPNPVTDGKNTLQDGTPIKLRLSRNMSSADAHTGETVDFEVLEDVKVGDVVVVAKGGIALGTVTEAEPKRRMGRGGKLNMTIDFVRLADGEKAALRGVKDAHGGGHAGAMTAGIVATSLIVWPAAPFFLFMHGKDIVIPKGTEITAYTNGGMQLDLAKFAPQAATSGTQPASAQQTTLEISSTPSGADIEVDGNFVGSTPSSIGVAPGDHVIKLSKAGYLSWDRKLRTSSGNVKLSPELERKSGK